MILPKGNLIGVGVYFLLISVMCVRAQTSEQSGLIKTATGILVVSNEPDNYYSIEVKGKSIKPIPDHPFWFYVDGKFVQIVCAEKREFLKDDKGIDDKSILLAHQKWESDYISETLGAKLKLDSSWLKLSSDTLAMAWSYDMPQVADKQTAKRQLYLLRVKGKYVFGLNTVVEKDGEEKVLQQFLVDTLETLKPRDRPLSLEKARDQILRAQ